MIKILFVIPTFKRGGVERITLNILNLLDPSKFDICLMVCIEHENELLNYLNKNIKIIELKKRNVRNYLPEIYSYIQKEKISLIFSSFDHLSLPLLFYKLFTKNQFKVIVRLNTLPSNRLYANWKAPIYDFLFSFLIKRSDVIISQSEEMTQDILNYYRIKKYKVTTIPNPIDVHLIHSLANQKAEITFDNRYYNLIAIGSLSNVKGYDLLIKAFYNLKKKGYKNFRLYIVGDNRDNNRDYKEELEQLITRLNIEMEVVLLGFRKNPYNLLKQADAFVLSSRKEGFPNVVLEALSLNKPCLVTNCVDLSNLITKEKGIIVEKNSVQALEEGLLKIVNVKGTESTFSNFNFNEWFEKIYLK